MKDLKRLHDLSDKQLEDLFDEVEEIENTYDISPGMDDENIIWKPQPGSQTFFLACPIYECLLTGPRGTGKTDVLLMDFAKDCGIGWENFWRGIILRESYKQLSDVIVKSRRWFPKIFPGITFNKSDLVWTWPTGETLMLSYLESPDNYSLYHGWELPWCVSSDTPVIMGNGEIKLIGDIKVGEQVLTLEGPKPILRVTHSFKSAVEVSFFDDHDQLLGTQIQGEGHQILSIFGMHNEYSQDSSNATPQSSENQAPWIDYKSLQDSHQHNQQVSSFESNQVSRFVSDLHSAKDQYCDKSLSHLFRKFLQFLGFQPLYKKNKQSHNLFLKNEENSSSCKDGHTSLPKEWPECIQVTQPFLLYHSQFLLKLLLFLRQKMGYFVLDYVFRCASLLKLIQYFLLNRFLDYSRNDGQSHQSLKNDQDISPLHALNVVPIFHSLDKDDVESIQKCEAPNFYIHPYSKVLRRSTLNHFSTQASCKFTPLKDKIHLVDLTVADVSHYITNIDQSQSVNSYGSRSVVNRNCGFEELTNWNTDECYELMKTCCRSSCPTIIDDRRIPKRIRATTNPYGKGHAWVKRYFINPSEELQITINNSGQERTWINSNLQENRKLLDVDPEYQKTLESIKDPNKRKAWLEGSWDIVSGGIIGDLWDSKVHVLEPFPIPKQWRVDRAFDWGSSTPFAVGWFAESDGSEVEIREGVFKYFPVGTTILIHEWYGWTGEENVGIVMPSQQVAKGIIAIEKEHKLLRGHKVLPGPADNQIFNNMDGETIASKMTRIKEGRTTVKGVTWKRSNKNPGSRINGLEIFRGMVSESLKDLSEEPCFYVFNTCRDGFLRTVPTISRSDVNPDDAYKGGEDHVWDMVRYRVLSRIHHSTVQEI